jgi:membrane protein
VATASFPVRTRPVWALRLWLRLSRSCRLGAQAAVRGVIEFYHSSNLTFASSIAYYSLLSFFPFVLLLLTIFARFAINMNNDTFVDMIMRALPSHFDFVIDQVEELSKAPPALSVIGTILMFWAAMGFFGALTSAIDHAWGVEKPRSFFRHKLFSALMLLIAGLLLVTALSIVSFAQIVETQWFARLLAHYPALGRLQSFVTQNVGLPLFILIVGLVYYFVPNAKVRLRDVWWGAVIAGGLWRLAFAGFSWYVRDFSRFSVHGSIAAVVVFLVWVYVSAVILLYGVEVSAAYARLRKNLPQRAPAAAVRER